MKFGKIACILDGLVAIEKIKNNIKFLGNALWKKKEETEVEEA